MSHRLTERVSRHDRFFSKLLADSGSLFVQISDENVHRVRCLLDEVFGDDNFCAEIPFRKTTGIDSDTLPSSKDWLLWYGKSRAAVKVRRLFKTKVPGEAGAEQFDWVSVDGEIRKATASEMAAAASLGDGTRLFSHNDPTAVGAAATTNYTLSFRGTPFRLAPNRRWRSPDYGMRRLDYSGRLMSLGSTLRNKRYLEDYPVFQISDWWDDTGISGFGDKKTYVVQTATAVVERCLLLTTDPGDLVLDPTCGSGTTATVSEQWGRRWITIDTSRVALALARARIMGARYPYYLLSDSPDGIRKEAEVTGRAFADRRTYGNVRHGFVYERVPHITLKSIANNAEIDVLYHEHQPKVQAALDALSSALRGHTTPFRVTSGGRSGKHVRFDAPADATFTMPSGEEVSASALVEWEVPREAPTDWPDTARKPLADFWEARIARQKAIDESIAAKAEFEYLYDRPYEDKNTVRVAGPFTVESLSPHRTLGVDEHDNLIDPLEPTSTNPAPGQTFEQLILDNLRAAGVQQAHKEDRITFTSLVAWPGQMVCAEGRFRETESALEKRAAIFIGPEFGTVARPDLVQAAREAGDAGFDVLIACAFNYEAHASEFSKLGRIPVLKARMNADLHMGGELKTTGKGNLFVIFGEPDIEILHVDDGTLRVHVKGVDVFDPTTGEVRSDGADGIACWFIDTDYNEESFFVRHAYFLGQNDPYGALKTTLKAEIDAGTWATLNSDISRPFPMPASGRIAVKVINHLGDEVMKVFRVN